MTIEATIFSTLSPLVDGRCFPDFAPVGTPRPYITYQQVGGDAVVFTSGELGDHENAEMQVNVWDDTRTGANQVAAAVEVALVAATAFCARPRAARVSTPDAAIPVYGTRQDFSIWAPR
jgi:hypothetical protein